MSERAVDGLRDAASAVTEALFELQAVAFLRRQHDNDGGKDGRRFIAHLRDLERASEVLLGAINPLRSALHGVQSAPVSVGGFCEPSAHEAVYFAASVVLANTVDAMLGAAYPDTWPPREPGEHPIPDELPCDVDCLQFVDAALIAFSQRAEKWDLSPLPAMLDQEAARLRERLRPVATSWSAPDSPSRWARRFGCCLQTFQKRVKEGKIRALIDSPKSYRIHADDLPKSD